MPELGYRVVFVRQRKTRPAQEQDGLLARWVGSLWLDECEEPAAARFRAEERWYVVWFLAGLALGSDFLLLPTAVAAYRVAVCVWAHHAYIGRFDWVDFLQWILGWL